MSTYRVSPYGGRTFRLLVTDCAGAVIPAEQISRIAYTVWEESLGVRTPVSGHTSAEVSASCYLETVQESADTGGDYNFEHRVSGAVTMPFPKIDQKYVVVYTFYDADSEPHPCEISCFTETTE